jgi:hypothetical protein
MVGLILLVVASKHIASSPVRKPLCLPILQIAGFGTLQNSVEIIRSRRQVRSGSLRIGSSLSLHAGLHRRQDQPFGFNLNVPDTALLMRVYIWLDRSLLVPPSFPRGSEREQRGFLVAWRLVEPKK